jgi:hypothetical protein
MASSLVDGLSFQLPATIGLRTLVLGGNAWCELIDHAVSPSESYESAVVDADKSLNKAQNQSQMHKPKVKTK